MRLLLVEDDEKIASFVEKGLRSSGFAVDLAQTGTLGLDMALSAEYDTLIVDIMLPEMDGFALIEQLRAKGRNTPIIVLSARDRVGDRVRGLEAGADDYDTKPVDLTRLLSKIEELLGS